jgi:hypothetical protein
MLAMPPKKSFWQKNLKDIYAELLEFLQHSWPINWSYFIQPNRLAKSVILAPYYLKAGLAVSIIGAIISVSFLGSSVYYLLTTEVADKGGDFREVVLGQQIKRLNPVLQATSELETKINNLLFHPLYRVEFPDFGNYTGQDPKITPILLADEPTWGLDADGTNPYKILKFKLKDNIKWSDNTPITIDDIIYSFERIKEEGGNSEFRQVFLNYEVIAGSGDGEFEIRPNNATVGANPQLIYLANFTPISEKFYNSGKNSELATGPKSLQPVVSSGYFTFPQLTKDPDTNSNQEVQNPIQKNFQYSTVVLNRNSVQNLPEEPYLDRYIFKIADQIEDKGGDKISLQGESNQKKVDFFNRFLSPSNNQFSSSKISEITRLKQKVTPTNTYFSLFLNIQASRGNLEGYFINQGLRKYLICNFINHDFGNEIGESVDILPTQKRLLPLQFGQDYNPDCTNPESALLEQVNTRGSKIYTITNDERNNIKQVQIFGQNPEIILLALQEFEAFGNVVQNILQQIGLPSSIRYVDASTIESELNQKNYHIALIPTTLLNGNLYPIFGLSGRNISNITQNERVEGRKVEEVLKTYSDSNLQDKASKDRLVEFFKNQFISVNLFRTKQEINYSSRVNNLGQNFPDYLTFNSELYLTLPRYYTQTKRQLR